MTLSGEPLSRTQDPIFDLGLGLMRARLVPVLAELRIAGYLSAGQQSIPGTHAPFLDRFLGTAVAADFSSLNT